MKINILGYILILLIVMLCIKFYTESEMLNLKCIISGVDGNRYCVRERTKINEAADKLANINAKLQKLVEYCYEKYPNRTNIKRLKENFNPKKICETLPTSEFTAYSENKGEKLAFCLNKKKDGGKLIDENTLTFVAIHELAHVCTESVGHNDEFWKNFKFLLEQAVKNKLYIPVDYKNEPKEYCGMKITDNPIYDY